MKCIFCPRQATESLRGIYDVCQFCKTAFEEGFNTGRIYESDRRRFNPRKLKRGLQ